MLNTKKLTSAIQFALFVGTASLVAGNALAQTQEPQTQEEPRSLDRIEVTGSRIRQVDIETAQPVTFITRQEIEKQGFQSVGDILQNVTSTGTPPISRAAPLSSGENVGGTYISLRNLGAARTLVLLNGKRLGITTAGLADISTIPAAAVERIEVLKDGASAVYGSDAISGVINVITRTNYEGAAASAYYGQYSRGDGAITRGDLVMGFGGDRGSLTAAAEWTKEDEVWAKDRAVTAFPRGPYHPTDGWTVVGQKGGFVTSAGNPIAGIANGNRVVVIDGADPRLPSSWRLQNTVTGTCLPNSAAAPGPNVCTPGVIADKSNSNEQMHIRVPLSTKSLYLDGTYQFTDRVRFRTNLMYSNRVSSRSIAGYPMQAASFGTPMAANSYFNPTGADISSWWRRTWEVPRVTSAELNTYRFNGEFAGDFDLWGRTFDWDVGYLHNRNSLTQATSGNLNLANTRAAVGPSFLNAQGQVQCGTAAAPIPLSQCVPFNPFLDEGRVGQGGLTGNTALQNFLFQEEHSTGETKTEVMYANLTGPIVTLPAGDLAFAFGLEQRKESGKFTPDALAVTAGSTNLAGGPTRGGYKVQEAYLELEVPVLRDVPFAQELVLNGATRYSKYDTFGNTTNNKFGLRWKPIDQLMFRATVADGFRAPTISDLYNGGSQTFSTFTDPCDTVYGAAASNATVRTNCANGVGGNGALGALAATYRQLGQGFNPVGTVPAQTPVAFTSGSNPTLSPETSKSKTVGVVWSPTFAQNLNFALDWWKIRVEDTIVGDTPSLVLADCYVQGIASRCAPALFTRDPVTGIPTVSFGNRNAGYREVEGYDFDVTYRWNSAAMGDFRLAWMSTYTAKDVLISTNDPRYPLSSVGFAGFPRIRSNANLSWERGILGFSWAARYYSSAKESCSYFTPTSAANLAAGVPPVTVAHLECNEITYAPTGALNADGSPASSLSRRKRTGSVTFNDVQMRIQAPWNATIALGANNVFDRYGPVMYSQPSSNFVYDGAFDIGRFWYFKYTQRF